MFGAILMFCGWLAIALAFAVAIVVTIYNWGACDMEFGKAAWEGAKIWMWMIGCGIVSLVSGVITFAATK